MIAKAFGALPLLTTSIGSGVMDGTLAAGQAGTALPPHAMAIGAMLFVLIPLTDTFSGSAPADVPVYMAARVAAS